MILTIREELRIIFYLICYGIFVVGMYDLFLFFVPFKRMKKYLHIIIEILYWLIIIFITYQFSYSLHDGYIPLYFAFFLLIGALLYWYFFKNSMIEGALMIKRFVLFIAKPVKKALYFLFVPNETLDYLKIPFQTMGKTLKYFWKTLLKKPKDSEDGTEVQIEFASEEAKDISIHV